MRLMHISTVCRRCDACNICAADHTVRFTKAHVNLVELVNNTKDASA